MTQAVSISLLRKRIREEKLSSLLISSPKSIRYITSFAGVSETEREAYVLITTKRVYLFTNALYFHGFLHTKNVKVYETSRNKPLYNYLAEILKDSKMPIGFEANNITVAEYVSLKKSKHRFKPVDVTHIRVIKTDTEIQNIKMAATIASDALSQIKKLLHPGVTEKEIAQNLEQKIREAGAEIAFQSIVAFGKNAAVPHYSTGNTVLKSRDVVLIDFGAKYNGYCSDCTRTFFIGKVPDTWKNLYNTVQESQNNAVNYLSSLLHKNAQIFASEIDSIARSYIVKKGYVTIPHSLGHGIGLEVHEAPSLAPNSKDILTENMVFSIEPGIYIPGEIGVRIEDLYTIQKGKLIPLT